jgi:hypothetical protein
VAALADDCEQLPPPAVTVKRIEEAFTVDTRTSYRTLNILGAAVSRPGNQVLGLTRGSAVVKFETRVPSYTDRSGQWECASPQLTMSFGFSPMVVYVATEFPEGSCAYKEIYQHEMRHVKAYQAHIVQIEKDLTATLNQRFTGSGPWRGPVGQTQARLQRELNERWMPFIKREINRVDAAQALIDTPEEYARVASSCKGEIKKIAR